MPLTATMQIIPEDLVDSAESRADRRIVTSGSTLRLLEGVAHDVTVEDLSTTGCLLHSTTRMTLGTRFRLGLRGGGAVEGEVVRIAPNGYGCVFPTPISAATFAASFGAEDVVHPLFAEQVDRPADTMITVARWPRPVRAATIVLSAVTAWAVVATVALVLI